MTNPKPTAERILKSLNRAQNEYEKAISAAESSISSKVEFEFSIFWQKADGFVIANNDMGNAPLDDCLNIIKKKGLLSLEDYNDIRI